MPSNEVAPSSQNGHSPDGLESSKGAEFNAQLAQENAKLAQENAELMQERDLMRMVIDNLPDYVALFNIFNDDSGTALTLLRKYNDRFTTDDILNLGFPLSEMLKALEVEDIGDSEMMMSELMYSDGPENIKEAVMAKLLN